ncbi:hypothetical protein DYB28_004408 [Aphanomyces astaci]|uniref:Uncharacterized protein n=2 Tax=Aphanomyces astaci TaxID=112090 RepID=A0A397ELD4_APHAT|nr:hypothetical protein DYB31_013408 [Aphanomyces astaci]RLO13053.1 hypothetical protein DYB28_004408 [Aphanomyces astaci]
MTTTMSFYHLLRPVSTMLLGSVCMLALAAAATSSEVNLSVVLPGNYVEVTTTIPVNLPFCASAQWAVQGKTYDGLTACTAPSNLVGAVLLSVNPFRCAEYSLTTDVRGVFGCNRCYLGSHATPTQVFPAEHPNNQSNVFYVRESVTGSYNMASCLYTQDKGLASLCDVVHRDSIGGPSNATCIKGTLATPFATPLNDAAPCKKYAVVDGEIACK